MSGNITMKRTAAFLAIVLVCCTVSSVYGLYKVRDQGMWPKSWPKELDGLRKQSRTFEGPVQPLLHYAIPFTKRESFEAAWPHLLKVKSKGTSIVLRRAPSFWLGGDSNAGVCVHTPPKGEAGTTYIELIVDGQIVDLNRIRLPADTLIIDERFKDEGKKEK
jgi:hypothetical protein